MEAVVGTETILKHWPSAIGGVLMVPGHRDHTHLLDLGSRENQIVVG
jgi:hypothetical protein